MAPRTALTATRSPLLADGDRVTLASYRHCLKALKRRVGESGYRSIDIAMECFADDRECDELRPRELTCRQRLFYEAPTSTNKEIPNRGALACSPAGAPRQLSRRWP